ncbi:MAG: zeta toxin family protein [Hyphomicrobiales bacterium]
MTELDPPVAIVFGGGIGVGKTTLCHRLQSKSAYRGLLQLPFISSDAFPTEFPHLERSRKAERALEVAVRDKQPFVWEATFGWSPSRKFAVGELEAIWLTTLRNAGYKICFHGVTASPDVVWRRLRSRELTSKRYVDADWRVEESAELFLRNVPAIRSCCHRFRLWLNEDRLRPTRAKPLSTSDPSM